MLEVFVMPIVFCPRPRPTRRPSDRLTRRPIRPPCVRKDSRRRRARSPALGVRCIHICVRKGGKRRRRVGSTSLNPPFRGGGGVRGILDPPTRCPLRKRSSKRMLHEFLQFLFFIYFFPPCVVNSGEGTHQLTHREFVPVQACPFGANRVLCCNPLKAYTEDLYLNSLVKCAPKMF